MPTLKNIILNLQLNPQLKVAIDFSCPSKSLLDSKITGITQDPFKVKPGYAYLCLEEEEFPSHFGDQTSFELKATAKARGAICFISERQLPDDYHNLCQLITDNINRLAGFFAAEVYSNPFSKIAVVGITGTKGKTTTSKLISDILSSASKKTGVIGTIGIFYPDTFENAGFLSNPHAADIFEIGAKMRKKKTDVVIMEVTSHGAIFERNSALEFNVLVMTNMTSDHLDFHKTISEYKNAKLLYFKRIAEYKNPTVAIFNKDDHFSSEFIAASNFSNSHQKLVKIITYSINDSQATIRGTVKESSGKGSIFEVTIKNKPVGQINLPLPGLFNVYNSLAAIATSYSLGISWPKIKQALENKTPIPGRFEKIPTNRDFMVIVDYAHTYDSLKNILINVRELTDKKLLVVMGCGGNRDATKRPLMGKIAAELADVVIITSDNPRYEDPLKIIEDIKKGIARDHLSKVLTEPDRKKAIIKGIKLAAAGDLLLIAGKGHEQYQIIGNSYQDFSDSKVVKEFLSS